MLTGALLSLHSLPLSRGVELPKSVAYDRPTQHPDLPYSHNVKAQASEPTRSFKSAVPPARALSLFIFSFVSFHFLFFSPVALYIYFLQNIYNTKFPLCFSLSVSVFPFLSLSPAERHVVACWSGGSQGLYVGRCCPSCADKSPSRKAKSQ